MDIVTSTKKGKHHVYQHYLKSCRKGYKFPVTFQICGDTRGKVAISHHQQSFQQIHHFVYCSLISSEKLRVLHLKQHIRHLFENNNYLECPMQLFRYDCRPMLDISNIQFFRTAFMEVVDSQQEINKMLMDLISQSIQFTQHFTMKWHCLKHIIPTCILCPV